MTEAAEITPWLQAGSFGVLVLFFWHVIKVQIPRAEERADLRDRNFLEALKIQHDDCAKQADVARAEFSAALSHDRATSRQEAAFVREFHDRQISRLAESIQKLSERLDEHREGDVARDTRSRE